MFLLLFLAPVGGISGSASSSPGPSAPASATNAASGLAACRAISPSRPLFIPRPPRPIADRETFRRLSSNQKSRYLDAIAALLGELRRKA